MPNWLNFPIPLYPASQLNLSKCQADFTCSITVNAIKIQDAGKGTKSVADDLEPVLRKIEVWHQGSITGFKISCRDAEGCEQSVKWEGKPIEDPEGVHVRSGECE